MCLVGRSTPILRQLFRLGCSAGVLGLSIAGCSVGGGGGAVSPEAQAKAKESFKKKFDSFGEKRGRESSPR
jgi:hypothetical protein